MSADRWAKCPNCLSIRDAKLVEAYGVMETKEYLELVDSLDRNENTLREDFYIGTDESGVLVIEYNCECYICKFRRMHKQEVLLL